MGKITWLGHATFMLEIRDNILLFDPWITGNPCTPLKNRESIERADFVLVTHDHGDHGLDDGLDICQRVGATLICTTELAKTAIDKNIEVVSGNLGGQVEIGDFKVLFTPAIHVSSVQPCGFVVATKGLTIYHAGDTAFFADMEWIGKKYILDWAFLPIGSVYTMGPMEAVWAVERLGPGKVIPCHYNTYDRIRQDPEEFKEMVGNKAEVVVLSPGQSISI